MLFYGNNNVNTGRSLRIRYICRIDSAQESMPSYQFKTPFILAERVASHLTEMAIQQPNTLENWKKTFNQDNKKVPCRGYAI